ncbi:hypothetical protein ABK040_013014 [Willaertia magna]
MLLELTVQFFHWINTAVFFSLLATSALFSPFGFQKLLPYLKNTIPVPYLYNVINQARTVDQMSHAHHTEIVPHPFFFSIWGLIYFLLFIHLVTVMFSVDRKIIGMRIGFYFLVCQLSLISWLFIYCLGYIKTAQIVLTIGYLCAIIIYNRLNIKYYSYREKMGAEVFHIFTRIAFSVLFAWLTVAMTASLFSTIKYELMLPIIDTFKTSTKPVILHFGEENPMIESLTIIASMISNFTEKQWSAICMFMLTCIGLWFSRFRNDCFVTMTFAWALIGIYVNHLNDDKLLQSTATNTSTVTLPLPINDIQTVKLTSMICGGIMLMESLFTMSYLMGVKKHLEIAAENIKEKPE